MFDHVKFGVSDYAASKAFFLQALAPLGVTLVGEGEPSYGVTLVGEGEPSYGAELAGSGDASLCLYQSAEKPAPLHIAFRADSREQVDAFWQAALAAGGKDNGAPGLRPNYHASYYAAFVIAPDGHNIEAVCHLAG
ncbi:VOC family protein [Klebsiella pneumoniae]|uniref:VOC family protein n=1 Tax=Klebsiella pneumoniae TaxID=573 RepID=UPI0019190EE3|nr:VOC family protein [Klebsiella pneumoniae]MCT8855478.1 VOC family protein [Klebsiella pneumoniae]UZI41604.1 VOC family protein [Klebsiella pneumoniae]UZL77684.1 VOC family protein [Klebsiella pneumoniae]HCH6666153.1 VOC family protein [Klebsiella pneumoniae]